MCALCIALLAGAHSGSGLFSFRFTAYCNTYKIYKIYNICIQYTIYTNAPLAGAHSAHSGYSPNLLFALLHIGLEQLRYTPTYGSVFAGHVCFCVSFYCVSYYSNKDHVFLASFRPNPNEKLSIVLLILCLLHNITDFLAQQY